jgi:hypothetical protein
MFRLVVGRPGAELAVMRLGDFCRRRDAKSSRSSTAPPSFLAPSSLGYTNKETRPRASR